MYYNTNLDMVGIYTKENNAPYKPSLGLCAEDMLLPMLTTYDNTSSLTTDTVLHGGLLCGYLTLRRPARVAKPCICATFI